MNKTAVFLVAMSLLTRSATFGQGQTNTLPPEKQQIEQQYQNERQTGAQNPAPRDPNAPYPTITEKPFQQGIVDDPEAPFSATDSSICNRWQGIQSGTEVIVYAGADGSDASQGLAIVMTLPEYPAEPTFKRLQMPMKAGQVCVISAANNVIALATKDHANVMTLNVATGVLAKAATIQCTGAYFVADGARATFGFSVVPGVASSFSYNFRSPTQNVVFSSTSIDSVSSSGNAATFTGKGTLNGVGSYDFNVTAKDLGPAGSGLDSMSLKITGPNGYSYSVDQTVSGGDIVIHP